MSVRGRVLRTYWGWPTGSTSGKGWEKVAAPDGHAATPQTPPMNHSATSARSKVWMTLEKQKERRKKRRRRQQSSTALHRGRELPNASTFHGERRAARSLTWGNAGVGWGGFSRSLNIFFFFKGKPRWTARWLSEPDWKWRMVFGNYATVSHTFALGAIVQQCTKLEGGAIVEWEQLSGKNEFSLHLDLFCHVCWLGNKINVEKNKKLHKRLNPSIFCICKKKKKSDTHPQTWKTADAGATNRPLWSTTETHAEHKGHWWYHASHRFPGNNREALCETAGLDDGGEPTVPAWKDLK